MGHRANLVLIRNNRYDLHYCHWCANTLPRDIFWGPDHAAGFIQQQQAVDADAWLDTVWAEGGVVLDLDHRTLILYGGEDLKYDIPLRRLYLALLRQTWPDWEIDWATKGIVEMAEYVDFPREHVIARDVDHHKWLSLTSPDERDWVDIVGSARLEDGSLRIFPLAGDVSDRLRCGPELIDLARATPGLATLDLAEWGSEFPKGGFHLDPAARRLTCWSASEELAEDIARECWPDWEIRWLRDGYEEHLRLLDGCLRVPQAGSDAMIEQLRAHLLADTGPDPTDMIRRIAEEGAQSGREVSVNPSALRYDPQRLPADLKAAIWQRALAGWRAESGREG